MSARYRRINVFVLLVCFGMTPSFGQQDASSDKNRLEALIQANEAARSKIVTAEYTVVLKRDFEMSSGRKDLIGENKIKRSMKNRWNHSTWNRYPHGTLDSEYTSNSMAILNERYEAVRVKPTATVYAYLNESIDARNERNRWPGSDNQQDLLPYSFGTDIDQSLREALSYDAAIPFVESVIDEPSGKRYEKISVHEADWPGGLHAPKVEYYLDPEHDYQIVRQKFFNLGGGVWIERQMTVAKFTDANGSSVSFPTLMVELRYGEISDDVKHSEPKDIKEWSVESDPILNVPIPDEAFLIDALDQEGERLGNGLVLWDTHGVEYTGKEARSILSSTELGSALREWTQASR